MRHCRNANISTHIVLSSYMFDVSTASSDDSHNLLS